MLTKLKEYFAGREIPTYLVGGYLRDSLLSLPPQPDIDLAVSGDSQSVGRDLATAMGATFVPLGPDHGVARVVVDGPATGKWKIDLVSLTGDIEQDLARRDFTIDALALPLSEWASPVPGERVIDPFNGRQDLVNKCIRALNPRIFQDDPGRLLRSVRLATRLRFRLDPETARQALADASHISRVALDRVRDEFLAILALDGAKGSLEALDRLDLLCRIVPELAAAKGVDQPKVHYWDVWGHLMHAVESAERVTRGHQHSPVYTLVYWTAETEDYFNQEVSDGHSRRTLLKLAALFHDICKPKTKQVDEAGRTRFPGHSEAGAAVATQRLSHLRISSQGVAIVAKMVEQHLRPTHMMQGVEVPTNRAIFRFFRDLEGVAIDTLYLCLADFLAAKGPELNADDWANRARMITHVLQVGSQPVISGRSPQLVDGHELMAHFNLDSGPEIGLMLDRIAEARAVGDIATREEAITLAAEALAQSRMDS